MTNPSTQKNNEHPYTLKVELAVVDLLGKNLYSNYTAVVSELVANAWDAEAETVDITINDHEIIVRDDGVGMSVKHLNDRFLTVGYQKRKSEGDVSPNKNRLFMGRKGIGKLSIFSLAKTINVFSRTADDSTINGFKIDYEELKKAAEKSTPYNPKPVRYAGTDFPEHGTCLKLTELNPKRIQHVETALRTNIARRFPLFSANRANDPFTVRINGKQLKWEDRRDAKNLQFLWILGDPKDDSIGSAVKESSRFSVDRKRLPKPPEGKDWRIDGWIGTTDKPSSLAGNGDEANVGGLLITARNRPIQDDLLDTFHLSGHMTKYLTGKIEASFLDDANEEDIATTDRQRLFEDDERTTWLKEYIHAALNIINARWSKERSRKTVDNWLDRFGELRKWHASIKDKKDRQAAARAFAAIARANIEDEKTLCGVLRYVVLAFERDQFRRELKLFEEATEGPTLEQLLQFGAKVQGYEESLTYDIVKGRLEIIKSLGEKIDNKELEKAIQAQLFEHPWLIDPTWSFIEESAQKEEYVKDIRKNLETFFEEQTADAKTETALSRLDIRYIKRSGSHVIIELKRPGRKVSIEELANQGAQYYEELKTALAAFDDHKNEDIVVIFIVSNGCVTVKHAGRLSEADYIENALTPINGRLLYFENLIVSARSSYQAYENLSSANPALARALSELDAAGKLEESDTSDNEPVG